MIPAPSLPARDRVAYFGQQFSLWAQSFAFTETARVVTRQPAPPLSRENVRFVRKRFVDLLRLDVANVERGLYPRELLFQVPMRRYLAQLPALLADAPRVLKRVRSGDFQELPSDVNLRRYPPYYRRTFHWQTDGYLSRRSAELYDLGVEILFRGTADVMRRQVIPPVTRHLEAMRERPSVVRLLDVACGTGRTLTQLAKAHPGLSYYGVDLSPFYVQEARRNLQHVADVSLLAENAERLPFVDGHFDIVVSVYLFHELPRAARRNVVREMARVLKPGGLLVLEDSAQSSESPDLAPVLAHFSKDFHEPFYRDYTEDDLAALAAECGFEVTSSEPHLVAKVVSARKSAPPSGSRVSAPRARRPRAAR